MFNKFKLRKAPLSLSSVSNAIKLNSEPNLLPTALLSKDLSVAIAFYLGLPKNLILAVAYDPVQLLFAVSTKNNEVRVFGQYIVEVVFQFKLTQPITELRFVKGVYLLAISPMGGAVTVLSLYSKQILGNFSVPGLAQLFETDYSLDWLLCGLGNGQLMVYDIDRLSQTPFRVDNLQKKILPKHRLSPIYMIEWHPRDIGTILLTYSHLAILYSFTRGEIIQKFIYVLEKGSKGFEFSNHIESGGKKKVFGSVKQVIPEIKEAHFHPNGLHVLTVHVDNTLCFWDAADGTLIQARSLFAVNLNHPGTPTTPAKETPFAPITAVRWVCSADPEITQLIIAGGDPERPNVLSVLDFGQTLSYTLTSHEKQSQFYALPQGGQRQIPFLMHEIPAELNTGDPEEIVRILPVPPADFCYFNGNHDPHYLFLLSNYGSLYLVPYSSTGEDINVANLLMPPSLSMVIPPVSFSKVKQVPRVEWYSLLSLRKGTGASQRLTRLLKGGLANENSTPRPVGADPEARAILCTGHELGVVRLLDISRGAQHTPELIVQINLNDCLFNYGHPKYLRVSAVSVAFESREMLIALALGEVVICRFGKTTNPLLPTGVYPSDYGDCPIQHSNGDAKLLDIRDRAVGSGLLTFIPLFLLQLDTGEIITCIRMCDAGFAAIGYNTGRLVVCDVTRGPAVIYNQKLVGELLLQADKCYPTCLQFTIMEDGQDGFSLLMLLVGTNGGGHFLLFKLVPMGNGGWLVNFSSKTANLNYRRLGGEDPAKLKLDKLIPVNALDGSTARASLAMFERLAHGVVIPGYIVVTSDRDIRVLKPPKQKLSHKVVDETCIALGILHLHGGICLAVLTQLGFFKLLSIPSLSDLCDVKLPKDVYEKVKSAFSLGISSLSILASGLAFIRSSGLEAIAVLIYATDKSNQQKIKENPTDVLFNETAIIPPRPTALAMLWAKGQTTYVTSDDLASLLCGPNRKPPKYQETELAYNISPEANPHQVYGQRTTEYEPEAKVEKATYKAPSRRGQGGYGMPNAGMFGQSFVRSLQDGLNVAEETFHSYANSASEALNEGMSESKKTFYTSAIKLKAGF